MNGIVKPTSYLDTLTWQYTKVVLNGRPSVVDDAVMHIMEVKNLLRSILLRMLRQYIALISTYSIG